MTLDPRWSAEAFEWKDSDAKCGCQHHECGEPVKRVHTNGLGFYFYCAQHAWEIERRHKLHPESYSCAIEGGLP